MLVQYSMGITWRKRRKSSGKTEAYGQYGSSVAKVLGWVRLRNLSARDVVVNSKEMNAGWRPVPGGGRGLQAWGLHSYPGNSSWHLRLQGFLSLTHPKTEATLVPYCPIASVFPNDFWLFLHIIILINITISYILTIPKSVGFVRMKGNDISWRVLNVRDMSDWNVQHWLSS